MSRRRLAPISLTIACLASLILSQRVAVADGDSSVTGGPDSRFGMNLTGPVPWNPELPLVDVFKLSTPWRRYDEGLGYDQGPPLELDSNGWVKRLDPGCYAVASVCTIAGRGYPTGDYTILWDGKGSLDTRSAGAEVVREKNRLVVRVGPGQGFHIRITETNTHDYIRNIRVILPGLEDSYEQEPWNPSLLKRWEGIDTIRFKDYMKTDGLTIRSWSDRPTLGLATYSQRGVPLEMMLDLANRLHANPWFTIPEEADNYYVRQFAIAVREGLDPSLTAYIEYSNETWDTAASPYTYTAAMGLAMGLSDIEKDASLKYTAYRSMQIFQIFEQEFDDLTRIVRVIGSQAVSSYATLRLLEDLQLTSHFDALAIAPYFKLFLGDETVPSASEVESWTLWNLYRHVEKVSIPGALKAMTKQKVLADTFGLRLIAYEGGQSIRALQDSQGRDQLLDLIVRLNRHPLMGRLYDDYLDGWDQISGDLFCHYTSFWYPSMAGCWGSLELLGNNPRLMPKFDALMRWAARIGRPMANY